MRGGCVSSGWRVPEFVPQSLINLLYLQTAQFRLAPSNSPAGELVCCIEVYNANVEVDVMPTGLIDEGDFVESLHRSLSGSVLNGNRSGE